MKPETNEKPSKECPNDPEATSSANGEVCKELRHPELGSMSFGFWFLTSLILLVLLCAYRASMGMLLTDELFSLTTAEEPIGRMIALLRDYRPGYFDHPPLYFLLLRPVLFISSDPFALRLPSLLFIACSVAMIAFFIARSTGSALCSTTALAILVTHPLIIYQATFVRMYSLVALLSCVAIYLYVRLATERDSIPPILWISLGIILSASAYTIAFGLLVFPGLGVLALAWLYNPRTRQAGLGLIGAIAVAVIIYLPWFPILFKMLTLETSGAPGSQSVYPRSYSNLLVGCLGSWWALALVVLGWFGIFRSGGNARRIWFGLLFAFLIVPGIILLLVAPDTRPLDSRYLMPGILALMFGACLGASKLWIEARSVSWKVAIAVAALMAVSGGALVSIPRLVTPPRLWWEVARILENQVASEEIIMTGSFLTGEAVVYHMNDPEGFAFLHYVTAFEDFSRAARNPRVVWYVNGGPLPEAYSDIVDTHFPYVHHVGVDPEVGHPIVVHAKRIFDVSPEQSAERFQPAPFSH